MPATEEQIVIEFTAEYSSLDGAVDVLEKAGQVDSKLADSFKKTTAEFNKQDIAARKLGTSLKGPISSIDQLDKRSRNFVDQFVKGFEEGVKAELLGAKKEIDAMRAKLEEAGKKGGAATGTLKQQLRQLTAQIAQAKASGGPVSQEMINKAGQLKDAIADANSAIKTAGSDTRGLDNLVGTAQAAAGGFAVLQGSMGLFAGESEELQKTLLQVNSAMSILQGITAVQNALLEEGAIVQLAINVQQKIAIAQTNLETAAQSKNIVIKYAAIVAQKALNLAMSANPIAVLITLLVAVAAALYKYSQSSLEAASATGKYAGAQEQLGHILEANQKALERNSRRNILDLEKEGATQSRIIQAEVDALNERLRAQENAAKIAQKVLDETKHEGKEREELQDSLTKTYQNNADLRITIQEKEFDRDKQLQKEREEAADKAEQDREARNKKREEDERRRLADAIARTKRDLLLGDETAKSYKTVQIALINLQAQYDSVGKSADETALIMTEASLAIAKINEPIGKAFKATIDETQALVIDTTKALKTFTQGSVDELDGVLDATEEAFGEFLQRIIPEIQDGLNAIATIGDKINSVADEATNNSQIAIENEKAQVDEALKAGATTEKEAKNRQLRIEQQEKVLRRKQAQREKDSAIFAGLINVAQAITKAFTAGPIIGQVLAGVVAALGAAQVALIASRPIPNFYRGKKSKWEGMGRYGEAGAEMRINADGTLEYATKPTVKYIGPDDIILNPHETQQFMSAANDRPQRQIDRLEIKEGFDYNALGAAVGKNLTGNSISINIEKDFIREEVAAGLGKTNWMGKRYSFKK